MNTNQHRLQHQSQLIETDYPQQYEDLDEQQISSAVYLNPPKVPSDMIEEYNPVSRQFEYFIINSSGSYDQSYHQSTNGAQSRTSDHLGSNSYLLPQVNINNGYVVNNEPKHKISEPALVRESPPDEIKPIVNLTQSAKILDENYYSNTYEQQPIYDMQLLKNETASTVKHTNILSLVRQRTTKKAHTLPTVGISSTSISTTTTTEATTVSNIMSMLPHKILPINYTDVYNKFTKELAKHINNQNETALQETHFMGMSSNTEHLKLSYDLIDNVSKQKQENQSDTPNTTEEYVSEVIESEPGIGFYTVNPKRSRSKNIYITTTPYSNSGIQSIPNTLLRRLSTQKPTFIEKQNLPYNAILAPVPTTTVPPNLHGLNHSTELPALANNVSEDLSDQQQIIHREQFSTLHEPNQQLQPILQNHNSLGIVDVIQDIDECHNTTPDAQQFADIPIGENTQQSYVGMDKEWTRLQQKQSENTELLTREVPRPNELQIDKYDSTTQHFEDMQGFDDMQQSYIDMDKEWAGLQQTQSNFELLTQVAQRQDNRNSQLAAGSIDQPILYESDRTSSINRDKTKMNWFQRQWKKFYNI